MKMKIDKSGCFSIERAGKWKEQFCPLTTDNRGEPSPCGDWCPLFGEQERKIKFDANIGEEIDVLNFCHIALFGKIIDERVKP